MIHDSIIVVGAGGTGSHLIPALTQYARFKLDGIPVLVYDPDRYDDGNLQRQNINSEDVGQNKANVMGRMYGVHPYPIEFNDYEFDHIEAQCPLFISCADNHVARLHCIEAADTFGSAAIICGNETIDAEAYYYRSEWRGSALDPRVYYGLRPETPDEREARRRELFHCNETPALLKDPQLVIANHHSATYALHLLYYWSNPQEMFPVDMSPIHITSTANRFECRTGRMMEESKGRVAA